MLTRVFLLVVYVPLSFEVSLLFIRSDSLGSYAPPAILFSWGILPGQYGLISNLAVFWLVPIGYLVGLFGVMTVCGRSPLVPFSVVPFVIHGLGVALALTVVTQKFEHAGDVTPGFLRASYIVAVVLAATYLFSDWWLARKTATLRPLMEVG